MKIALAALALLTVSTAAMADEYSSTTTTTTTVMPSVTTAATTGVTVPDVSAPSMPAAGSVVPSDPLPANIVGKRLLDANGAPIGKVVGMADHGNAAIVSTASGRRITIDKSKLTPGNGENTLIATGFSQADILNHIDRHQPIADGE